MGCVPGGVSHGSRLSVVCCVLFCVFLAGGGTFNALLSVPLLLELLVAILLLIIIIHKS